MVNFELRFDYKAGKKTKEYIEKSFSKLKQERDENTIGYYKLPNTTMPLIEYTREYIKNHEDLSKNAITDLVIIGIGGSSLGTKAIDSLLNHKKCSNIKLSFLENCDPININATLKDIKKESTIFIIISKSGTTIETTSIFKYILERYEIDLQKSEDTRRLIAITDEKSPLWDFAIKYNLEKFTIPKNVGGRFSVLSAVGVVPLTIVGYDMESLAEGALAFEESFFNKNEMHLMKKAYFYYAESRFRTINVLFSYSSQFEYFNNWYTQLWGESLGKIDSKSKKVGLTPVGLIGSVDQHSFLQLVVQGPEDKTLTFIKIDDFEDDTKIPNMKLHGIGGVNYVNNHSFGDLLSAQCMATLESIEDEYIPLDLITLDRFNEENVGTLIYYYELLTSAVGAMLGIDAYDQPGVENGKKKLIKKFVNEA